MQLLLECCYAAMTTSRHCGWTLRSYRHAIVSHMPVLQDIVTWKGGLYFKEDPSADQPGPLAGSIIAFTKNGKSKGAAYRLLLLDLIAHCCEVTRRQLVTRRMSAPFNAGTSRRARTTRLCQSTPFQTRRKGLVLR